MQPQAKRERLIAAATDLGHRLGLANASLATIAEDAEVPVGNIYYYFKTKEELASAVVEARRDEYTRLRRSWDERSDDPVERLIGFVRHTRDAADELSAHGCPIGGLCNDLARTNPELGAAAGEIFVATIDWAAGNWAASGHPRPHEAATRLVALIQGATVLAHALGDPEVLRAECEHAEQDLRRTAAPPPAW